MIQNTVVIFIHTLFATLLFSSPVSSNYTEKYDEIRLHNAKIESRLQGWMTRAKEHAHNLEHSTHYRIAQWRAQLDSVEFSHELPALQALNSLVNADIVYTDDYTHFHKKDYWADPETTLEEGGDCEDIALVKAASLHRLGWPVDRMQLLVGLLIERGRPESHAVLLVENSAGEEYILRSISNEVVTPDSFAFLPVYAVDGKGTIVFKRLEKN